MSAPDIGAIAIETAALKAQIDALFARLKAISPGMFHGDEAMIQAAFDTAMHGVDLGALTASLESVVNALKAGRSISGGGANASLS